MYQAYKLPDGRVVIPKAVYEDGKTGDGWVVVTSDSTEAEEWRDFTIEAPPEVVAEWSR